MSRETLSRLKDPTLVALCVSGRAWPKSLLSETRIPDAWMGLVETRDGRRRCVPAGEDPRPDDDDKLLLVRNRPIAVSLAAADVSANCGNAVSASGEILVRWQARDDELAALRRKLLTQDSLSLQRLSEAVSEAGAQTLLHKFIRANAAERLVREDLRDEFLTALREQLKRFAFEAGLTIERVAKLELSSATLARQQSLKRETAERVERIKAREMVEQAALAATQRRLGDLGGVLEKLKTAAGGDENSQWHDLLPALSPAERGRLLENLWRITPDQHETKAIVAVAGNECVWLDPARPDRVQRRVSLGDDLGGLRSVTFCPRKGLLLVGAARGVWTVDASDGRILAKFEVPDAGQPRTGFNAATTAGRRLFATHSQLGCWTWPLDDPSDARALLEPTDGLPKAIRGVIATDDERIVFAADDRVHILDADGESLGVTQPAGGVIHCLSVLGSSVYVGIADGTLLRHELDGSAGWSVVHRTAGAIESVKARRWNDLVELVVPGGRQGVCGVYGSEGVVGRLMETSTSIRRAWAGDDIVVGLNDHRDRLVILNARQTDRGVQEAPVARMVGRSIQDACLVMSEGGEGQA